TVLYLSAALAYFRFDTSRSGVATGALGWWYACATGLFGAALLSKSVTATLPAALLVLVWWRRGYSAWRRDVGPLVPWFVMAIVAGWFTAHVERTLIGAQGARFELGFVERLLVAGRAVWFYLGKLL